MGKKDSCSSKLQTAADELNSSLISDPSKSQALHTHPHCSIVYFLIAYIELSFLIVTYQYSLYGKFVYEKRVPGYGILLVPFVITLTALQAKHSAVRIYIANTKWHHSNAIRLSATRRRCVGRLTEGTLSRCASSTIYQDVISYCRSSSSNVEQSIVYRSKEDTQQYETTEIVLLSLTCVECSIPLFHLLPSY